MPTVPTLSNGAAKRAREDRQLQKLLSMIRPVPKEWLIPREGRRAKPEPMGPAGCSSWKELVNAWRKAMKWTEGLDRGLSIMLASAASTQLVGEQLWFKVLGPPGSGKTTILEGLSVSKKYVFSKDSIRGFYQGWRSEDGADLSIASLARGKTLATKDGDTLLKAPNLHQILSEARGLYDRVGRTHYRNAVMNDYEGHRMTWILCGTAALREIDESELGNRFLDCVIMDRIDDEFEDDVGWRAINQEVDGMLIESNGRAEGQHHPDLSRAMRLTGGYVEWLRENIIEKISRVRFDQEEMRQCLRLGKFVAYMRARPHTAREDADPTREFSARLDKQHGRLARVLAVVLNRSRVDTEVMRRVRAVAMDTSRGVSLDLAAYLLDRDGLERQIIENLLGMPAPKVRRLIRFLRAIGVIESFITKTKSGLRSRTRYRLTEKVENLYREVVEV